MFPTKWTIYQAQLALPDNEVREPTEHSSPTSVDVEESMSDCSAQAALSFFLLPLAPQPQRRLLSAAAIKGEEAAVAVQCFFLFFSNSAAA